MYKLDWPWTGKGEWFEPETQPLTLAERDSTSTITIARDDSPEIGFNDWLLQDDGPEGPIVWQVKGIDDSTDAETITIELEHVIKFLEQRSLFSEVTTQDLAGDSNATTVTAKKAVQYLLGLQTVWTLGDFEYTDSNPYEFDGDTILDAIETISDSLDDCVWEYDFSTYPFVLHMRRRDTTVSCEMRAGRNLTTVRKSITRSGMYTRIYPIGKNDLHIDGDYISRNEDVYGRIDKIETDQSKSTKENLYSWADSRLKKHCEPNVSISVSGMELASDTGEDLDQLVLNKVCQVPLPKYRTTITERIVKKTWKDWKADKISVTVTLANNSQDITTIIRNENKANGKAKKGNAKQNYLFEANGEHLYYEVFDDCGHLHSALEMTEQSLRIAFDNTIQSTRSEFLMTSESLRIQFENDIASTRSEFQMTSESLRVKFENDIASTRSEFQMTSESLRIAFESEQTSTRSEFIQQANLIGLVVDSTDADNPFIKAAEIVAEVNKDGSTVRINGNRVKVGDGTSTVTLNNVMTISGDYTRMVRPVEFGNANATVRTRINGGTVTAQHYDTTSGGDIRIYNGDGGGPFTVNYASWAALLTGVTVQGGNTKKFTITDNSGKTFDIYASGNDLVFKDNTENVSWSFSKAVASMGWSWSNGTLTVTPSPQNEDFVIGTLAKGTVTYSNGTYTIPVNLEWGSGANTYTESTGKSFTLSPSVTAGTSAITWDSTNKYFYNYGYAYMGGGSSPVATSAKRTSSGLSTSVGNWTDAYTKKKVSVNFGSSEILSETITVSVAAGTSAITWDSSTKKFYNYGYAYLNGNSAANATSTKRESSALSIGDNSWSNGSKKVWVKHGSSEILSDTVSIPSVDDTTWENTTGKYWRARLSIGGVYRYSSTREFTGYTQEEYDAYWYNGFNDSSWVSKHGLQISHDHHEKLENHTVQVGETYEIWPNFMKRGLGYNGTSDDHYLYGDKVTIYGPSVSAPENNSNYISTSAPGNSITDFTSGATRLFSNGWVVNGYYYKFKIGSKSYYFKAGS